MPFLISGSGCFELKGYRLKAKACTERVNKSCPEEMEVSIRFTRIIVVNYKCDSFALGIRGKISSFLCK